jgi:hypothetical protein
MADDGYTTVLRTTDPSQGELVAEMLRREGIEARFHQVRSTLIGIAGNLIEMTVDVPIALEARAREVLADLEYVGAAEAADQDGREGAQHDASGPLRSRRHPLLAAGFALLLPAGGGHLYARRPWTALIIASGVVVAVACLVTASIAHRPIVSEVAIAIWVAIIACDALGGVRAARGEGSGEKRSQSAQVSAGVVLLGAAIVLGTGLLLAIAGPRLARMWRLAKYQVSCGDGTIVVKNRDDRAHTVGISQIRISARPIFGPKEIFPAGPVGPNLMDLAPGGRGVLTVEVSAWLADTCGFTRAIPVEKALRHSAHTSYLGSVPVHFECGFLFDFSPLPVDGEAYEAIGACMPSGASNEVDGVLRLKRSARSVGE